MSYIEKEKLIKADIASIENRVRHAFNQGYDLGFKDGKKRAKPLEPEPSYNSVNSLAESKLKNPKAKTFDILHFVADNAGLSTFEAIEKAYHLGVSEQENVIDKIRAEILRISSYGGYELGGYKDGYLNAMANVLSIIDKHTIGSEKE